MAHEPDQIAILLRDFAPQVLGIVARRWGQFDACEDAVQEALLDASLQWQNGKIPEHPRAWLVTVAMRRLQDQWRSERARRRREELVAEPEGVETDLDPDAPGQSDDTLALFILCCHPALNPTSQIALTLRAVGGLTTGQIAAAFLVPEATMAQRISRAKAAIRKAGARFELPLQEELADRLRAVMQVLYLMFNEGYAATSGEAALRPDLTAEAIRLTRLLHQARQDDGEVAGLLALTLLTDARRPARLDAAGDLVPLDEQDRSRWNAALIAEGTALLEPALQSAPLGAYQIQAAIAAIHSEAPSAADTDWEQIVALYDLLISFSPNPIVALNRAAAVGMASGSEAGLILLDGIDPASLGAHAHRLAVVRGALLERAGRRDDAREAYRLAARMTASEPERRYLERQATRLDDHQD